MRVAVSGGGTGGHIFPALAVCEGLKRQDANCELLYIGSTSGMESEIVPKQGVPYQRVTADKLRKVVSISTIGVLFSLFKGYREARTYLRAFKAEAVVGTGGYVAAAAALAGANLGIPTLIVAPDAIPGRTNWMLSRFAKRICVVFEQTVTKFPAEKTVVTGLPLRSGIVAPAELTPQDARCRFPGLSPDRFTILVIGGSQGARALNNIILEAAPEILASNAQILHQVGQKNIADAQAMAKERNLSEQEGYCPLAFLDADQVPLAYRAADLIVCRGGMSTLSEVMANGLPSIIVPLPSAYADHQTVNAQALSLREAALLYPEYDLTPEGLLEELHLLRETPGRLQNMGKLSREMGSPDAADKVSRLVLEM